MGPPSSCRRALGCPSRGHGLHLRGHCFPLSRPFSNCQSPVRPWASLQVYSGNPWTRYSGHLGPSGPKSEKESVNEFPGPVGPEPKESKKSQNRLFVKNFDGFSTPISGESWRSCPNRRRTRCTEHGSNKIRPSKKIRTLQSSEIGCLQGQRKWSLSMYLQVVETCGCFNHS